MMENKRKTFKMFEEVLIREKSTGNWIRGIYCGFDKGFHKVETLGWFHRQITDECIIPYKRNEHLLGWNGWEEFVDLEPGEYVMVNDNYSINPSAWRMMTFSGDVTEDAFKVYHKMEYVNHHKVLAQRCLNVVRFSEFNPNDMEQTREKALCVKNGKIIRYKTSRYEKYW